MLSICGVNYGPQSDIMFWNRFSDHHNDWKRHSRLRRSREILGTPGEIVASITMYGTEAWIWQDGVVNGGFGISWKDKGAFTLIILEPGEHLVLNCGGLLSMAQSWCDPSRCFKKFLFLLVCVWTQKACSAPTISLLPVILFSLMESVVGDRKAHVCCVYIRLKGKCM